VGLGVGVGALQPIGPKEESRFPREARIPA
jgi:hypothetical protein